MYYHIRIELKDTIAGEEEYKLDRTKEDIIDKYITPYHKGDSFIMNGKTINPNNIKRIHINRTKEKSKIYIGLIKQRWEENGMMSIVPPEYELTELDEDVTDEFIKGSAGYLREAKEVKEVKHDHDKKTVFIVHGRDENIRRAMFEFLRSIGLHPLEWSEAIAATGKGSPFIGEILDVAFERAQAIVVIFTPDDIAYLKETLQKDEDSDYEKKPTPQARPNVLFEAGMAMGRNQDRTIIVECGKMRPFSDFAGRHTIRMDNSHVKRKDLAQRLENAGCGVSLKGTDWLSTGNFEVK